MSQLIKFSSLALLVFTIAFSSCGTTNKLSTKEVLLRFQPKNGDNYVMKMDLTMNMEGPQSMTMLMTMVNGIKVNNLDKAGSFDLDNVISKMTMSVKNPTMNIEYDSDNPDMEDVSSKTMHETMSKMLNVKLTSKMDNRGKVLEMPDLDKIFGDNPELKGQLDQMNNSLQNSFISYPEQIVKVGDSWNSEIAIDGQMPMNQIFTYTIKEITATTVNIDITGTVALDSDMADGSGTSSGMMTVDRMTGFIRTSNMKQTISMEMMGMTMKIINDVKLTMTKK